MVKVRLQGTTNEIRRMRRIIERNRNLKVLRVSELFGLEVTTLTDDMWEKFLQDVIVYPGGRLEIHWNFEEEF